MSPDLRGSEYNVGDWVYIKGLNIAGKITSIDYGIRQSEDEYCIDDYPNSVKGSQISYADKDIVKAARGSKSALEIAMLLGAIIMEK